MLRPASCRKSRQKRERIVVGHTVWEPLRKNETVATKLIDFSCNLLHVNELHANAVFLFVSHGGTEARRREIREKPCFQALCASVPPCETKNHQLLCYSLKKTVDFLMQRTQGNSGMNKFCGWVFTVWVSLYLLLPKSTSQRKDVLWKTM